MAFIIRSLGNPPIWSLLRSTRSSRLLPISLSLIPKLSYSTAPVDSQSEVLPNVTQLLIKEIGEMRKETWATYKETQAAIQAANEKTQAAIQAANEKTQAAIQAANEKTQSLLEERAELFKDMANLKRDALEALDQKLRVERNFNVRGALERIVFNACMEKKIRYKRKDSIQTKLNAIVKLPDFQTALQDVVTQEKLVLDDVKSCIKNIYHEVSKHAHGNQDPITVNSKDFTRNELAALMAFLEAQKNWPNALSWNIEKEEDRETPTI